MEPPVPTRPLLITRRNSFSRGDAASITKSADDSIHLCVNGLIPHISPRKSNSFSLPRSPVPESVSKANDTSTRPLRSSRSDIDLHYLVDSILTTSLPTENEGLSVIEPPRREGEGEDGNCDSPASTTYSSASPNESDDDDRPDAFETWLQQSYMTESLEEPHRPSVGSVAEFEIDDVTGSANVEPWLGKDSRLPIELSKSVQQIEHEIRNAIDSVTVNSTIDILEKHLLSDQVGGASAGTVLLPRSNSVVGVCAEERELLLLMEVVIGDGRTETIEICVGDQPPALAESFARRHGLVAEAIPRLTQHIQDQLDSLENEDGADVTEHVDDESWPSDPVVHQGESLVCESDVKIQGNVPVSARDECLDAYVHPPPSPSLLRQNLHREHEREHSYNHLMEKYGHYTSHSNKVNPAAKTSLALGSGGGKISEQRDDERTDPLTKRNLELSEHTRLRFTTRPIASTSSSKIMTEKDSVYNRLYALAEARERWIRRQQKIKAADEVRERQAMAKLEISSKSRSLIASRGTGGFANVGERLYEDAINDIARKQREREKHEIEKVQHVDWTCPKCAFVNGHNDTVCKNVVAAPPPPIDSRTPRRETALNTTGAMIDTHAVVVCGQERPQELFRPTLVSAPASVIRAVHHNKLRAVANSQRLRTQQQVEDEFRQTCPFKPQINELSEEIMRDKLEQEAKAGGSVRTSITGEIRRKNPHLSLYEDAFHARAQREAREEEYLKQFSFKPNIGVNALWSKRPDEDGDVVERLAVSKFQELERKRHSLHVKYAPDRDPVTGREFFKPQTGRAPIFNRNERRLPIGEFLYEAHKEQEEYIRCLRQQQENNSRQRSEQRFVSEKSAQALEARKKKTFCRLFEWLCKIQADNQTAPDESANSEPRVLPGAVDLSKLQPELLRIVNIIFEFANYESFTLAAFEGFMEKLMAEVPGFTCTQVLFLTENLRDGKSARRPTEMVEKDLGDVELTFHPAIDKNSDALAKKHGRAERLSVFEALNQDYEHYRDRQAQAKKQLDREFVRAHPFHPTFYTKDRKTKSMSFYSKLHRQETAATTGSVVQRSEQDARPSLRTAVTNARPFVRPLGRSPSEQTLRSRSSSPTSSKSEDEDAALTSHVLAAMGDGPLPAPSSGSMIVMPNE